MLKYSHFSIWIILFLISVSACSKKVLETTIDHRQNISVDVLTLAADYMEGREVGTIGEQRAADYLVGRFEDIGLLPYGDNGTFFQNFTKKKNKNPHGEESESGDEIKGKNVIGFIDNKAKYTVVIGAHYDHLGYGEEGSLHIGSKDIHNGADDNASGVAGLMALAQQIKASKLNNYNYLFICFSGEEKGLWGSNYFVKNQKNLSDLNYMINMDMIGRLNGEKKLSISGVGTSPDFEKTIEKNNSQKFSIKKEMSGLGPSDHASFYNSSVPVLAFFTGQHSDYHKPSDDANLINYKGLSDVVTYIYDIISFLDKKDKMPFTKTQDESQTRMAFSVTLGVMPDYLYDGKGMKIDGVKDGKPAQLSGIQKGDIVVKMGELDVADMQAYMKCLSLFKPGQKVDVVINRDGKEMTKEVTF